MNLLKKLVLTNEELAISKDNQNRLRESELRFSHLVEITDEMIASFNLRGKILSTNRSWRENMGYSEESVKELTLKDIIAPEFYHRAKNNLNQLNEGITLNNESWVFRTAKGEDIYVEGSIVPILENGKMKGSQSFFRNITERKNEELLKEKVTNDLIKRMHENEQFCYIVSHNLRTPVANILGLIAVMKEESISDRIKENAINELLVSSEKLDKVIKDLNNILDVKQDEQVSKELVNFNELVSEVFENLNKIINREKIIIKTNFEALNEFPGYKIYLYSIFYNLISNSVKYQRKDVNSELIITSELQSNKLILRFIDNGMGIDLTEHGTKVFGLYKRFHPKIAGRGVGLYMVKTHVEKLGGKISIKSEINIGTEITIEFEI